jgi:hypothetical protein
VHVPAVQGVIVPEPGKSPHSVSVLPVELPMPLRVQVGSSQTARAAQAVPSAAGSSTS